MAKYKEIKGVTIQTRDEDPSLFVGSWAAGGNLNTDRWGNAGAGTLTSGLSIDGLNPNSTDVVEEYNGTSWTEISENNTARNFGIGVGSNAEAALFFTGEGPPLSNANELWNGSSWSEETDLNTARFKACGAGTSTAAIAIAGTNASPPSSNRLTEVEVWNGSSWTEVNEVNTGGGDAASAGTSTDSIKAGTSNGPGTQVETWDGTSFTETTELNTGRYYVRGSGPSGQTDTLVFGGTPPYTGKTEKWNGSSWTEVNDMSTGRGAFASTNTTAASAWAAGGTTNGATSGDTTATEEFTFPSSPVLTEGSIFLSGGQTLKGFGKAAGLPSAAWSSVTNINTARGLGAGCGTQDSALIYAGFTSPPSTAYAQTEEWNGSTWTEKGDLNVPFYYVDAGGLGTVTAALAHGGEGPSGGTGGETFNGSAWSEISNSNSNHIKAGGAGSSTAGLSIGSYPPTSPNEQVEEWNGSSWTEIADLNEGRGDGCGSGTSISAWFCGGEAPGNSAKTEVWDGTSWSETGDLNTAKYSQRGSGANQNDGLVYGGNGVTGNTELWNGSTWTEVADLATARQNIQSSGGNASSAVSAIAAGGYNGGTNAVEEFVVENTLSTVTVS